MQSKDLIDSWGQCSHTQILYEKKQLIVLVTTLVAVFASQRQSDLSKGRHSVGSGGSCSHLLGMESCGR